MNHANQNPIEDDGHAGESTASQNRSAAVTLANCLDDAVRFLTRFVRFPDPQHQPVAVALWVAHTYAIDAAEYTPYMQITGPEKRCGKSRLLEVLDSLVKGPIYTSSISPAALFRVTARQQRFIDEYMTEFNATAAARRAGYSAKSAHQRGYELVHSPGVAAVIKERGASDADVLGITRNWILTELREVLEQAKGEGKLGPANRALELLARLRGDLLERTETDVKAVHVVINRLDVEHLR
jgi:hypothetical protein